jgi:hypothetical protein
MCRHSSQHRLTQIALFSTNFNRLETNINFSPNADKSEETNPAT